MNGKWLAQAASGTQRYATEVLRAAVTADPEIPLTLVVPRDAVIPEFASRLRVIRSHLRGAAFEQLSLPWITRGGHLYSFAGPAAILKRDQTVVMHDATPFRYPSTFRRTFVLWYRLMYGLLVHTAARVFTVSAFSRSELASVLRVPRRRFELAPCGADHIHAEGVHLDSDLPFEGGYALLVGNLAPHKNTAAAVVALGRAGLPVAVVGSSQSQVFRDVALDENEHESVRFLGRVDDERLRELYAGAAVLVSPSRYEGFGIPVVEAGRLGCPSVVASGSAMTDVVGDGGLVFDRDDLGACVAMVQQVLADSELRRELGERARANAGRYTWSTTSTALFGDDAPARPAAATPGAAGAPERTRVRVLHVTESFAAGTGSAIVGFAEATSGQGVDSALLAQDRGSGLLTTLSSSPFETATILGPGPLQLWRAVRPAVLASRAEVVHVHSSLAGALVRVRLGFPKTIPVIYSPHCFAFERRDVPAWQRRVFRLVERVLARRTAALVCVSPHEADLARQLDPSAAVVSLVNVFEPLDARVAAAVPWEGEVIRVAGIGRISPQKDPAMFAEILSALRVTGVPSAGLWIGAGDDAAGTAALVRAGVEVTGWLGPGQVGAALAHCSVYVHTAAWEAGPIAVLDAMRAGLPVVLRRIDAYRGLLPSSWQFDTAAEAVQMVIALRDPVRRAERLEEQWQTWEQLAARSPRVVLAQTYRDVLQRRPIGLEPEEESSMVAQPGRQP